MKKLLSIILAAVMLIGTIPVVSSAAYSYVEVTRDNAPIRRGCYESSSVAARVSKGTVLEVTGSCHNIYLNKWYRLSYNGQTCYIYSGNVKTHSHAYTPLYFNGVTYNICNCGSITVSASSTAKKNEGVKVASSAALAIPLVAVDGPLPFGDIAAAGVLIVGSCIALNLAVPAVEQLAEMISEADFDDYLKKRENVCTVDSFRKVKRVNGTLKYIDNYCMDMVEAYVYVRLVGGDVYTASEDNALMLAAMHGSGIMERDKDQESYFYHYHLGLNRNIKGHIFFGANDFGQVPT